MIRVLYVEDNFLDAELAQLELAKHGPEFTLEVAATLKEARAMLDRSPPAFDLVLADQHLPDGAGIDLVREIRTRSLPLAVVILTGAGDEATAVAALKAGADDYLIKRQDYLARLPHALKTALKRFQTVTTFRSSPLRLLYVEHHRDDLELTRLQLLRHAPHIQMDVARDAPEALRRLPLTGESPSPYDVLLLDYRLPGINALELLKVMREERCLDIPVVLVTGQGNEEVAAQALTLGATDYVVKHAGYLLELPATIERAVHQARLVRERVALRAAEEKYRNLVELSPAVTYAVTADGSCVLHYISPQVRTLLGFSPEELTGEPGAWSTLVHPEDRDRLKAEFARAAAANEPFSCEYRVRARDGRLVWLLDQARLLDDKSGRTPIMHGVATDITRLREAEAELSLHNTRLQALLDLQSMAHAPEAEMLDFVLEVSLKVTESRHSWIGLMDESESLLTIHRWSRDAMAQCAMEARSIHYPMAEAVGWGDCVRQRRPVIINDFARATAKRRGWPEGHVPIERFLCVPVFEDSRIVAVSAVANREAPYGEGEVRALASIMNKMWEITRHRRDRQKIEHLNQVLRAIRDVNQLIVREKDASTLIRETCRLLVETRGYGACWIILLGPEGAPRSYAEAGFGEAALRPLAEALTQGSLPPCCEKAGTQEEAWIITNRETFCAGCPLGFPSKLGATMCTQLRHDGKALGYMSVSLVPGFEIDGEEQSLFGEMAEDVAFALHGIQLEEEARRLAEERRRTEAQLRQVQKMEALGTLAGGVAHDFNNILGIILGYADLMRWEMPEDSQMQSNLQEVMKAAKRAKDLVRQILAFSRQKEHEKQPVQIGLIIKEVMKMLRASLPATIEIKAEVNSKTPILADPSEIHQVLMNLCTNAAFAMSDHGGVLQVSLDDIQLDAGSVPAYSGLRPGPHVQLTVKDTGHGIEPEILDSIFDPFFTTKEVGVGTGLGLAVVHGIVKSHQGAIKVESMPGQGATFQVIFPAASTPASSRETTESRPLPRGRERIMVVDDEPALAGALKQMLEHLGYQVESFTSSAEALAAFRREQPRRPFDLVVTDMTMPNLTGLDLTSELRRLHPDLPVLICTGFSEKIDAEKARSMGIQGLITKPVGHAELAELVRNTLDGRKSPGAPGRSDA